jgi:hypothetical protein
MHERVDATNEPAATAPAWYANLVAPAFRAMNNNKATTLDTQIQLSYLSYAKFD